MSLHKTILDDAKDAMMKKEELRSLVLKSVKAALMNELLAKADAKKTELPDEEAVGIIKRLAKQRRDSIEQFTEGGRKDLADQEKEELNILENYLPTMMSEDEILAVAKKKKMDLAVTDKTKAGMLMSAVMKELKGKADGAVVKKVVDSLLV